MINKPTVFIIGAGASKEFGLPTGDELKQTISKAVRFRFDFGRLVSGDEVLWQAVSSHCKTGPALDKERQVKFSQAGNDLSQTIQQFPSIDEALHWWKDRPEIIELGKAAAAYLILGSEAKSLIAPRSDSGRVDIDRIKENWVEHFLSMAISALDRGRALDLFKNVTLINFNYDRTIEEYLFWALQQRARLDSQQAIEACKLLKIIRPYGSLGALPWQFDEPRRGVPYGADPQQADIFSIAGSIRTYTEQLTALDTLQSIRDALFHARVILFLGFGFHQQNIALLEPGKEKRGNQKMAIATAKGIDELNYPAITKKLDSLGFIEDEQTIVPFTASELLAKLRTRISMAVS